jgi:allophanate hydrolase subunit 1
MEKWPYQIPINGRPAMPAAPRIFTPRRGFARTGSIARSVGAEGRFGGMMGGLFGRR